MTKFAHAGSHFHIATEQPPLLIDKLPPGNFVVRWHEKAGYYLAQTERFVLPDTIYGSMARKRDRIIGTFKDRTGGTGALFLGEKGSGKTLLAKAITNKLAEEDIPTLLVNAPYLGDDFFQFLTTINQPCAVFFDEFEKVYSEDNGHQQHLLTLLDGVFPSKKLFLLTCNDKWAINKHMKNRPGRIFYMIDFKGVDRELIEEYSKANLRESLQIYIPKLITLGKSFEAFNFDMLKATIEEMNRYCEEPKDALAMLNIRPDAFAAARYSIQIFKDDVEIPQSRILHKTWRGNPESDMYHTFTYALPEKTEVELEAEKTKHEDENELAYKRRLAKQEMMVIQGRGGHVGVEITNDNFSGINNTLKCMVFINKEHRVHLTKLDTPTYEYSNAYADI